MKTREYFKSAIVIILVSLLFSCKSDNTNDAILLPKISGKNIYHYQVTSLDESKDKCLDIKLAEGLLPDVTQMLTAYQKIVHIIYIL